MQLNELKPYLDNLTYDKYYQDIQCIGYVGYSKSYQTWDNIKGLISWKDKKVADLGCNHGYFSFKIAREGGIVIGLDNSAPVLETTEIINELEGNIITTQLWKAGNEVPDTFDVALCLNVFHHFENKEDSLKNIKCETVIFEVNLEDENIINKYFTIIERKNSHRENRIILLAKKQSDLLNTKIFPETKIFVTGIYGSGKTHYAKLYAEYTKIKYIDFDMYFTYSKMDPTLSVSSEENLFNILSDKYIIDAIPFSTETGSTKIFMKYARENNVKIICCVCPDKELWAKRLLYSKQLTINIMNYANYAQFYYSTLPAYLMFNIDFFDTDKNEYITKEELYKRINWIKPIMDFV